MFFYQKSYHYTKRVETELRTLFEAAAIGENNAICLLATGSYGKYQLTPKSDIDLICIIDDTIDNVSRYKIRIQSLLDKLRYRHTFEIYPIETLKVWKWIAEFSTLYSSDLFYAKFLWGNISLYTSLLKQISHQNLDEKNQTSYVIYNYFYRRQQLGHSSDTSSLKYQKGGLREYQFVKWVARRIFKNHSYVPEAYLGVLYENSWITKQEYGLLSEYAEAILGYKWITEERSSSVLRTATKYKQLRYEASAIIEKIKIAMLNLIYLRKGDAWKQHISRYVQDADGENTTDLSFRGKYDESMHFCHEWGAKNDTNMKLVNRKGIDYWSVRAAIALNKHTSYKMLSELSLLQYPDMSDIMAFIHRNPNFKH